MRWILYLILPLFLFSGKIFSQASAMMNVRVHDTLNVNKYRTEDNGYKPCFLAIDPGEYRLKDEIAARLMNAENIIAIDLVYTNFPEGEDLTELNRKRTIELFMHVPKAFNKNYIHWRFIRQTACKRSGDLHNYFHGFVIYYRPLPTFTFEQEEITSVLSQKKPPIDSTVFKVFTRNNNWKDMLTVMDVTGSMSPYTAQLLLWLKLNSQLKTAKQIVFFNDNEENSTDQSVKSDTSGIWSVESLKFDKVLKTCYKAMAGGEHIENNLESIFYAVKKFPGQKKNIVMVADNWEDPCDMKLLPKLKELNIPVHIIVCGVTNVMNTNYLDIAYATGGSVHTMEEDLEQLSKISEGKQVKIGALKFLLQGGRFKQMN
jgi:hypothetical protein